MICILDAENILDVETLHEKVAEIMEFPDYYGKNLDALYDCLTDIGEETELVIENAPYLNYNLGVYAGKFVATLAEAEMMNPNFTLTIL